MISKTLGALVLFSFVLAAGGCLVTSGKSIDERGAKISRATLEQVEPGATTEAWLIATIGKPTDVTTVEGSDVRVLRYDYTVQKSEGGAVFLIFAGGSETTHTTTTYFEVANGIVTRYWTES